MSIEKIKEEVKKQFTEISNALFQGTLSHREVDETKRVFAEASPMFGLNIVRYSKSNFYYFFLLQKYLLNVVDLRNLTTLKTDFLKLKLQPDLLDLSFVDQIVSYENKIVSSNTMFLNSNYILHLFVYLHECGHINQDIKPEDVTPATNHFAELNADYFALTTILQYYYSMKKSHPAHYWQTALAFGNEHNFIRLVIINALLVIYLEVLPKFKSGDTETHPAIKKKFCYLIMKVLEQLKDNFQSLFVTDTMSDFIADIFNTLDFIERTIFDTDQFIFDNLLKYCASGSEEIQDHLGDNTQFDKFNI